MPDTPFPIDPNKTALDPDFGKPRPPYKPPQRVPQGASHDFGRSQRNVPTESIPQKDIPTEKISRPPAEFKGLDNLEKAAAEDEWEEEMRRELKDLAEPQKPTPPGAGRDFGRGQRNVPTESQAPVSPKNIPTEKIPPAGKPSPSAKTEVLSPGKSGPLPQSSSPTEIQSPRAPVRTIKPGSPEGLERVAQKIPQEVAAEAQEVARQAGQAGRSGLWSRLKPRLRGFLGPAALAGMAIGIIGFAVFEYATNEALRKIGPGADLSAFLPTANKVMWVQAPFTRMSREESDPYYEPNVVNEDVALTSPQSGILAFGISLAGLPSDFTNDTNINEEGAGRSDWLCEPFGGYLICRSMSGVNPLIKDKKSIISMQFHLPGYEMKKMLAVPAGTRSAYFVLLK